MMVELPLSYSSFLRWIIVSESEETAIYIGGVGGVSWRVWTRVMPDHDGLV